jgi:hypothetical protein
LANASALILDARLCRFDDFLATECLDLLNKAFFKGQLA